MDIGLLQEKLDECSSMASEIVNLAEIADRDLTPDENKKVDGLLADAKKIKSQIDRITKVDNLADQIRPAPGAGRLTEPNPIAPQNMGAGNFSANSRISVGNQRKSEFNLGQFAQATQAAAIAVHEGRQVDSKFQRILNAPNTYGTEGVGADGGFAVPPEFRTEIMEKVAGEDSLLSLTDRVETFSNSFVVPKDEKSLWESSGGIQACWAKEASQLTQSKIALESEGLKLDKLSVLIPLSGELLEDAPALDAYLNKRVPEVIDFKVSDAILNGTGAGQLTGIINASCLVSVAKESGQAADTIQFENLVNMLSRIYPPCLRNAVWICNPDVRSQLMSMYFSGASSDLPVWLPGNAVADKPYETLFGRKIIWHQASQTLGDKGDVTLCDLSQYMAVLKTGGIRADVSIHLYFDYDMSALRFILRIAGQPWWRTAITPKNSSNTLSCFVSLDARA